MARLRMIEEQTVRCMQHSGDQMAIKERDHIALEMTGADPATPEINGLAVRPVKLLCIVYQVESIPISFVLPSGP